jgi:phage protein U
MKHLFIISSILFFFCTLSYAQIIEEIDSVTTTTPEGTYKSVTYQLSEMIPAGEIEPVEFHSLAEDDSLGLISLYEFGQPVTSCDCNFQNLLRNWTNQFITNLEDTRLVTCKYIGIIEDSVMLNHYAEKLTDKNVLRYRIAETENRMMSRNRYFYTGTTQENIEKIAMQGIMFPLYTKMLMQGMRSIPIDKKMMKKGMPPAQIDELYIQPWRATFPQKVHIGDHVYMIYMKILGEDYINYAICSAQNHRVVWDNLFNFKVPISKITLKD